MRLRAMDGTAGNFHAAELRVDRHSPEGAPSNESRSAWRIAGKAASRSARFLFYKERQNARHIEK